MNRTWNKEVFPGSRMLKKWRGVQEQDREDKILSGEFNLGWAERIKRNQQSRRASWQTRPLTTTRGIQKSTPNQTSSPTQDQNCQR